MLSNTQKGDNGEIVAIKYLQKNQYTILDTNFRFGRFGEIDIIAHKNSKTIFIEVKYRYNDLFGTPEESITKSKLHKCKKTMEYYCKKHQINFENIQFDVITLFKGSKSYTLKHYKNIEL